MGSTWDLYRFYHSDGSSKDWAVRDNGNGTITTRWGKTASTLPSSSTRKRSMNDITREKRVEGYSYLGKVEIDENGRILGFPRVSSQQQAAQAHVESKIYWRIKPAAVDNDVRAKLAAEVARLQALLPVNGWEGITAITKLCKPNSVKTASGQIAKEDSILPVLWLMALKTQFDHVHMSDEAGIDISTDIKAETGVLGFFETDIATIRPVAEKLGLLQVRINMAKAAAAEIEDCWF